MTKILDARSIAHFHEQNMKPADFPPGGHFGSLHDVWHWIEANHHCNMSQWNEEDKARRTDVGAADIAASKRLIDQSNQKRNDAIEAIDEAILAGLKNHPSSTDARLNSETAGSMIDRLSILCLKIYHMRKQTQRDDVDQAHIRTCEARLDRLIEQRMDLGVCFDQLLADTRKGCAYFKVYRQFKMYNDPALNPYLYGEQGAGTKGGEITSCAIDVLIPTRDRPYALAVTLTALHAQGFQDFRVIVSDQSECQNPFEAPEVKALLRILRASGTEVETYRHLPRRGLAEQRDFLLSKTAAPYCLFLDDDVVLQKDVIARLYHAIGEQRCGFVGSALHGLSFIEDIRPHHQYIEFWDADVIPETVTPGSSAWNRHHLHSAANLFHIQARLGMRAEETRLYRVAWIGGCVLFDTDKLRAAGGFNFWTELPPEHCGEDVLAQLRVMQRFGGCGVIPSGAYHMELPTTVLTRNVDAPWVLPISAIG
jgi:hypothetical protein